MTTNIVRIPFHGGDVLAVDIQGKPHVILRPAIERLGLDYSTQLQKLKTKSWASVGLSPTQDQFHDMITVDVRTFLMLLATIDERRVAESVRPVLVAYQREVADVIEAYWTRGSAANPRHTQEPPADPVVEQREVAAQRDLRVINSMPVSEQVKEMLALHVWAEYSGTSSGASATVGAPRQFIDAPVPEPDLVQQWLADICEPYGPGTQAATLHASFIDWCRARGVAGDDRPTMTRLGRRLNALGYPARRGSVGCRYRPLRVVRSA